MAPGFLRRFLQPDRPALQPDDARVAIAAVLVMAARADDHYADAERRIIDHVLADRFGLTPEAAATLRHEGEDADDASVDHYQFTRAIKEAVPLEDRIDVVTALWRVVLADASRHPLEDTLMRQLADRLGLSPRDTALARQRVQVVR
jgi:uncharacterized tellurite resistance protein B-like protein